MKPTIGREGWPCPVTCWDSTGPHSVREMPVGVEDFEELVRGMNQTQYYFVDKTMLIREVLLKGKKVNLISRPRRFGKSLNLDMIRQFVSIDGDPTLFDGLKIAEDREFCQHYQCQYPVLYFNFKSILEKNFDDACAKISEEIARAMGRDYVFLQDSSALTAAERKNCAMYGDREMWPGNDGRERVSMPPTVLSSCFGNLCLYLEKHYHHKVAVLIDEYDVPLNGAWNGGYYDEMVRLMRNMFIDLLKGNKSLSFAILTGCLRISRESIFTGLNNLRVWSSSSDFSADYFGFTETEVKAMLKYYGLSEAYEILKEWYDGFRFKHEFLYCPWDVIGYVDKCIMEKGVAEPELYWINSSENSILRYLLKRSTQAVRDEYTNLVNGGTIQKQLKTELTFRDLENLETIWSWMTASGYLTIVSREGRNAELKVPNLEVRRLLADRYKDWIIDNAGETDGRIEAFCRAFISGNTTEITGVLCKILKSMLHRQDMKRPKNQRESLYQGIIMTLLFTRWKVKSNLESGEGFCDICFRTSDSLGVVIEVKDGTEGDAQEALDQIEDREYFRELVDWGCKEIYEYGIACRLHDVCVKKKLYTQPSEPHEGQNIGLSEG